MQKKKIKGFDRPDTNKPPVCKKCETLKQRVLYSKFGKNTFIWRCKCKIEK